MHVVVIEDVINIYNENNSLLFARIGQLISFTSNTISMVSNGVVYVFDENGDYLNPYCLD